VAMLFVSCKKVSKTIFDKMDIASIISLTSDTTVIFTTDYFPQIEKFDSIVSNFVEIIPVENGKVYQLVSTPKYLNYSVDLGVDEMKMKMQKSLNEWLGSIDFYLNGEKATVLLRQEELIEKVVKYKGKAKMVSVRGQMNSWNAATHPFSSEDGENWSLKLKLPAGDYQYLLVVDGKDMLDPENKEKVSNGMGSFNSLLSLKGVYKPLAPFLYSENQEDNTLIFNMKNLDSVKEMLLWSGYICNDDLLAPSFVAFWQNTQLPYNFIQKNDDLYRVIIPANAYQMERSYIRVYAYNADGGYSNDMLIPLQKGKVISDAIHLKRSDKQNMVIYSLMIDRFFNGDTSNDQPLNSMDVLPKVDYFGGDLKGVDDKINANYFNDLGINTVWLSPIIQNPYDAWGFIPKPKTKFSGYHGYWPVILKQVDTRFGDDLILKNLIDDAHQHHLNILLDWVANHAHINSIVFQQHPDWHTPDTTPDGRPNFELWDEFRLTTWFDKHIPTLDLEREEVYQSLTDSAIYWLDNFEIDGFRHDATKHIPEVYWRTLVQKIKTKYPHRPLYQIGETYGSPALINQYVKSGMLDAQFDFNLFDAIQNALLNDNASFADVAKVLKSSLTTYGYHHLMGNIIDNHDKPRFISLAGGAVRPDEDTKLAGWTRNIGTGNEIAYKKLKLLQAFVLTVPGIPCIYQGDEIGQPGANDPDNRRWMQFDNLAEKEQDVLNNVKKLTQLRKENLTLIYGDYLPLAVTKNVFAFARIYMGKMTIVAINKSLENQKVKYLNPLTNKINELEIAAMDWEIIN
jgi:glycosidase